MFELADYSDQTEKWFAELAARGSSVTISFRFSSASCATHGWTLAHLADYDTDERSATLEQEFLAGIEVDDVEAFGAQDVTRA